MRIAIELRDRFLRLFGPSKRIDPAEGARVQGVDLYRLGQNCRIAGLSDKASDRILALVTGPLRDDVRNEFLKGRMGPPEGDIIEDATARPDMMDIDWLCRSVSERSRDEGWSVVTREGGVEFRIHGGFTARFRDRHDLAEFLSWRSRSGSSNHMAAVKIARIGDPAFHEMIAAIPEAVPDARFKDPQPDDGDVFRFR